MIYPYLKKIILLIVAGILWILIIEGLKDIVAIVKVINNSD